jgi:hypothetical protein
MTAVGTGEAPLRSLAEKQGMRSACFFWPGSEAEIVGERPSYYLHFDDYYPDEVRIQQIVAWLHLPPDAKTSFHHALLLQREPCWPRTWHGFSTNRDHFADLAAFHTEGMHLYSYTEGD